jgi:myo-inositol-1(or 4)-monophosphatase
VPADRAGYEFAVQLATRAGRMIAAAFHAGKGTSAALKADGTEVTRIDTEVEEFVRGELAVAFPDDAVSGEEGGAGRVVAAFGGPLKAAGFVVPERR